jgi:hypothetical protein
MHKRDRFRTMINVWGDSIATGCVAHMSRKEVLEYEEEMRRRQDQPNFKLADKDSLSTLDEIKLKETDLDKVIA